MLHTHTYTSQVRKRPRVLPADFGSRFRDARKALGFSPTTLGAKLGVSRQTIYAWERGQDEPEPDRWADITVTLQVDLFPFIPGNSSHGSQPSAQPNEGGSVQINSGLLDLASRLGAMEERLKAELARLEKKIEDQAGADTSHPKKAGRQ